MKKVYSVLISLGLVILASACGTSKKMGCPTIVYNQRIVETNDFEITSNVYGSAMFYDDEIRIDNVGYPIMAKTGNIYSCINSITKENTVISTWQDTFNVVTVRTIDSIKYYVGHPEPKDEQRAIVKK